MKPRRILATVTMMFTAFAFSGTTIWAQQACLPGISTALQGPHSAAYTLVRTALTPTLTQLSTRLNATVDQTSYAALLTVSRNIANSVTNGRLLIALPDGTVVVDTGKTDDPTNTLPQGNSYQHFIDKTVNENHNSRVAIMSAQQYPCGLGAESKLSSTTGFVESYIALRLGAQLDSNGTARLSTH